MASGNDIKAASATYGGFLVMLKWGTIISAILAAIVVILIA
jgi:Bacterial aa3 type cytochrome c oxidase subunit IV